MGNQQLFKNLAYHCEHMGGLVKELERQQTRVALRVWAFLAVTAIVAGFFIYG